MGRGPFLDANGVGALPEDGPVRMCFNDQRAVWGYFGGTDMFGVTSRIGLFRGSINFGCDPDDLLAEADVTVYATLRAIYAARLIDRSPESP